MSSFPSPQQRPSVSKQDSLRDSRRAFLSRVTVLFLPLALLVVVLTVLLYRSEVENEVLSLRSQERLAVRVGGDQMKHALDSISRYLKYLAISEQLQHVIDGNDRISLLHLTHDYVRFLETTGIFDKIRWIDETGRERLRINYSGGRANVVGRDELQDKVDRYYFVDTEHLKSGDIYVSPLDLNVEHGTVEIPHKPVIRLSTPLFSSSGKRRGIIVLSYLAKDMLDDFSRDTRAVEDHIMVLNRDGYWIKSSVSGDEWGFMFGNNVSLKNRRPEIWSRLTAEDEGQFEDKGEIWTFSTVYPLRPGLHSSTGSGDPHAPSRAQVNPDEYLWKVVSHLQKEKLALFDRSRFIRMTGVSTLLLGLVFLGSWTTANAWARQRVAEADERRTAERMRLLMDNMGEGVFGIDLQGRCSFINPAALTILGYGEAELIGHDARALFQRPVADATEGPDHGQAFLCAAVEGRSWTGEDEFFRKDGTRIPVHLCATPIRRDGDIVGAVVVFQDNTRRKQLEDQLRHAQKMQAVGTLAGGVAHDFNNILTTISGHAHLLALSVPANDSLAEDIRGIIDSSARAKEIVQRLMTFSRKQPLRAVPLNLDSFVSEFTPFLRSLLSKHITLDVRLSGQAAVIEADRAQLEQALMNIVSNAGDSMPDGGKVFISTGVKADDDTLIRKHRPGNTSPFAFLSVQDSGMGMDGRTLSRIFEPFFTTKDVGRGTGLGLAVVYGIVEELKGFIDVQSHPGKGTSVTICLPLGLVGRTPVPPLLPELRTSLSRGNATILLVEDDEAVRTMIRRGLERHGYRVIEAQDGQNAIDRYRKDCDRIALVLADMVMPQKDGLAMYEELRQMAPGVRVIVMSGRSEEAQAFDAIAGARPLFVQKPLDIPALVTLIEAVLYDGKT